MKSSTEEWYKKLNNLLSESGGVLTDLNDVEVVKQPTYKELKKNYKNLVKRLTEQNKHSIPNIDNRGFNSYHIDHKISIHYGFKNNIPPQNIAHVSNLRLISKEDNCTKGIHNIIDEDNNWIIP